VTESLINSIVYKYTVCCVSSQLVCFMAHDLCTHAQTRLIRKSHFEWQKWPWSMEHKYSGAVCKLHSHHRRKWFYIYSTRNAQGLNRI